MTWRPRPIILVAFSTALAASIGVSGEARVEVASEELEPGGRQTVTVGGLDRGEGVELAWIDPTGRVRRTWDLRANRSGRAAARFRTTGSLPGRHRAVAWYTVTTIVPPSELKTEVVEVGASFVVLPGGPPEYLAVLDVGGDDAARKVGPSPDEAASAREGGTSRGPDDAVAAAPGFNALAAHRYRRRPPSRSDGTTAGSLVRVFEGGPPFLGLDPARLRALRTAYGRNPSDELLARPVCLHDRSWTEQVRRWAAPRAEHLARGRPWLWSLGRGVELAPGGGGLDFCRSPHCMRAFAGHLRRRYKSIEKLNRAWRTSFASFGEARPATTFEVLDALRALAGIDAGKDVHRDLAERLPGILASWTDHRRFLDATWARTLTGCRDLVRSADRHAKVGLEGVRLPGIFTGCYPTRCLRALDWVETKPRPLDLALARSFTPRSYGKGGFRTLTQLGSGHPALDLWRGFVNGHTGAILRQGQGGDIPKLEMLSLRKALRRLEGGLAALVSCSTWEPDPVAVLYSQDSVRVEWLVRYAGVAAGGKRPPAGAALAAWAQLLSDLGVSARFIDSRDVARKALRNSRARVLILPRAYVLGRAEFREIRRFVRDGGLVIADAGAGLYDETFTDSLEFRVGDLFAIERPRRVRPSGGQAGRQISALRLAGVDVPGAFVDGVGPEGLRVAEIGLRTLPGFAFAQTEGTPGGTPAVISSPAGRGRAVYLNLALEDYPEIRTARGGANLRRLVRNALELARVRPRVEVVAGNGAVRGCERNSWRLEETEVFTMWLGPAAIPEGAPSDERPATEATEGNDSAAPRRLPSRSAVVRTTLLDAELVFEHPAYCYDVLHGVLLGYGERIPVRLGGGANVFARMPYDVDSISIRARERDDAIIYEAVVETTTGLAGTHIVSQDLLDPRGRRVPGGSRIIIAERGVAKGRVRMALNEPPGEYSLVLRDATTGVEGTIVITRGETELGRTFPIGEAARLPSTLRLGPEGSSPKSGAR